MRCVFFGFFSLNKKRIFIGRRDKWVLKWIDALAKNRKKAGLRYGLGYGICFCRKNRRWETV